MPKQYTNNELWQALLASHKLLIHYASLLNMYDDGKRNIPPDIEDWVERLKKVGDII